MKGSGGSEINEDIIATGIDSRSGKYIVILRNYWSGLERVRVMEILDNEKYGPIKDWRDI